MKAQVLDDYRDTMKSTVSYKQYKCSSFMVNALYLTFLVFRPNFSCLSFTVDGTSHQFLPDYGVPFYLQKPPQDPALERVPPLLAPQTTGHVKSTPPSTIALDSMREVLDTTCPCRTCWSIFG